MLPAFVGAMLGSTTVKPGRVNVWGTVVAVMLLAVGISGIEQLGGAFYVEPLFNGITLVIAVGMAGWAARRRLRASRATPATEITTKAVSKTA
jgi:ribose transport system permease protein